uniref:Uncharacterized protein n=1 Tax=Oryza glumipatula TaxID=40148 RepID=A0A0D9YPE0_9ORYZ
SACRPVAGDAAAVAAAAVKATGERDNHLSDSPINTHLSLLLLRKLFTRPSTTVSNSGDDLSLQFVHVVLVARLTPARSPPYSSSTTSRLPPGFSHDLGTWSPQLDRHLSSWYVPA